VVRGGIDPATASLSQARGRPLQCCGAVVAATTRRSSAESETRSRRSAREATRKSREANLDKDGITEDIHLFNDMLREWENYYNYHRPHGALDGQTPYERLLAKTNASVSPRS
jgi:transposase InsO family protein